VAKSPKKTNAAKKSSAGKVSKGKAVARKKSAKVSVAKKASSAKKPACKSSGKKVAVEVQTKRSKRTGSETSLPIRNRQASKPRSKKTPLTKKQLEEFRCLLLEKRRTVLGDLNEMSEDVARHLGSGNISNIPTHMADIGTDNFEHEFNLGLLESEQVLLREIDQALRRIEDGTYGVCLGTGKAIPIARLRAKPWAKYTVEYARMLEQGRSPRPAEQASQQLLADE